VDSQLDRKIQQVAALRQHRANNATRSARRMRTSIIPAQPRLPEECAGHIAGAVTVHSSVTSLVVDAVAGGPSEAPPRTAEAIATGRATPK